LDPEVSDREKFREAIESRMEEYRKVPLNTRINVITHTEEKALKDKKASGDVILGMRREREELRCTSMAAIALGEEEFPELNEGDRYTIRRAGRCERFHQPFRIVKLIGKNVFVSFGPAGKLVSAEGIRACIACRCITLQNSASQTARDVVYSIASTQVTPSAAPAAKEGRTIMKLKLTKVYPDGGLAYGIPGVRGALLIKSSMLNFPEGTTAPEEIEVSPDFFRQPNADAVAKAEAKAAKQAERDQKKQEREAKKAERAAKVEERAQKAKEKAEKAVALANKLAEQAAKVKAPAAGDAPTSTETPEATATEEPAAAQ
jgi:hypothetical protein